MNTEARISLLALLKENRYEAALFGSYNVSFSFFEDVVLRTLQSRGCQHQLVLMDAKQCARDMDDSELAPRLAGRQYGLVPIRMAGAFHPKFVLLLGKQRSRLVVGSHNLTLAGFGGNLEITNSFDPSKDEAHRGAARRVFEFAHAWMQFSNPEMLELLDACKSWAPWLRIPETPQPTEQVILASLPSGPSMWEQLSREIDSPIEHVLVLGPYFDRKLGFLKTVLDKLSPKTLTVGVHPNSSEIPANAPQLCPGVRFVDLDSWAPSRVVHAKLLWLQLANGQSLLVSGSANPSAPAWLASPEERNAELVVLHRLPKGSEMPAELDLPRIAGLPEVAASTWHAIAMRQAVPDSEQRGQPVFVALATSFGLEAPPAFFADAHELELRTVEGEVTTAPVPESARLTGRVAIEPDELEHVTTARTLLKNGTRIALVQHLDLLREQATDEKRRALRGALLEIGTADAGFESLIQLVESVIFDESVPLVRPRASAREDSPTLADAGTVDIGPLERRNRGKPRIAEGDLALILDLLIRKLGEGITSVVESAARTSDEHITATSEPPPPPPDLDQGARLARACQRKTKRLVDRMERRLEQAGDGEHAVRVVVQLCATLGLIHRLQLRELDLLWLPRAESLVELAHRWSLFKTAAAALHRPGGGLAEAAVRERGSSFHELEECNALILWCAHACDLDMATAIPRLEFGEDADEEEIGENLVGLTLLLQCLVQPLPPLPQLASLLGANGLAWLERHRRWAEDAATRPCTTGVSSRGDVVRCQAKGHEFTSIVLDRDGEKVKVVDPATGGTRQYLQSRLGTVARVGAPKDRGKRS